MTTEEIKNLFPLKMRIIVTDTEKGEKLLNGETVTDSNGNEYAMGDNDIIGVPDDTDEKLEKCVTLDTAQTITGAKQFRNPILVSNESTGVAAEYQADGIYANGSKYAFPSGSVGTLATLEDIPKYYMHHLNIGYLDTEGSDWKSIQARYSFLHTSAKPLTLSDLNGSDIYTFVITNTSTDGGNTFTSTYNTILTIYNGLVYPHDFPMEDGLSYTGYSPTTFEDIVTEIGVFPPNTAKPIRG